MSSHGTRSFPDSGTHRDQCSARAIGTVTVGKDASPACRPRPRPFDFTEPNASRALAAASEAMNMTTLNSQIPRPREARLPRRRILPRSSVYPQSEAFVERRNAPALSLPVPSLSSGFPIIGLLFAPRRHPVGFKAGYGPGRNPSRTSPVRASDSKRTLASSLTEPGERAVFTALTDGNDAIGQTKTTFDEGENHDQ